MENPSAHTTRVWTAPQAGCRGLHTAKSLTHSVMDNPSGYPHAACQTASVNLKPIQKSEYQYQGVSGKAKDANQGDAMRRGYVRHELKP